MIKIPLAAVGAVNVINKRLGFIGWSKEQTPNSPEYKPYKITVNNMGGLFVKWCFSVNLNLDGEEYEIIIPPYENEILRKYVDVEQTADAVTEEATEETTEHFTEQPTDDEIKE